MANNFHTYCKTALQLSFRVAIENRISMTIVFSPTVSTIGLKYWAVHPMAAPTSSMTENLYWPTLTCGFYSRKPSHMPSNNRERLWHPLVSLTRIDSGRRSLTGMNGMSQ